MTATLRKYSSIDSSQCSLQSHTGGSFDRNSHAFLSSSQSAVVTPKLVMERRHSDTGTDVEQIPRKSLPSETDQEPELTSTSTSTQRGHFHRSSIANLLNRIPDPHTFSRSSILNHYACRQDGSSRHLQMEANVKMYQNSKCLDRYLFLYDDVLVIMKKKSQKSYHWKAHYETALLWMTSNFGDPTLIPLITTSVESTSSEKCLYLGWPMETWLVEYETRNLREEFEKYLTSNIHEVQTFLWKMTIPIRWRNSQTHEDVVDFCSAETSIGDLRKKWLKGSTDDDLSIRLRVNDETCPADLLGPENVFVVLFYYSCPHHDEGVSFRRNSMQNQIMTLSSFKERLIGLVDKDGEYNKSIMSPVNPPSIEFEAYKRRPDSRELFISDNSLNTDTVSDHSDHRHSNSLTSRSISKGSPRLKRTKENKPWSKKNSYVKKTAPTTMMAAKSEGDIQARQLKDVWPNGVIPKTFRTLCSRVYHLRNDNISTGVFRRSGNKEQESILVKALEQNESNFSISLENISPITMACAIKTFLRNLPEGLLENRMKSRDAILEGEDGEAKSNRVIKWFVNLADVNRRLACFLLTLLWQIHLSENVHKMGADALRIIMGPSLGYSVDLMQDQKILDDVCASVKYFILHTPMIVNRVASHFGDPLNDPDVSGIINQLENVSEIGEDSSHQHFTERASSEPATSTTRCVSMTAIPGEYSKNLDYQDGGSTPSAQSSTRISHRKERSVVSERFLKPPSPSQPSHPETYQPQIKSFNRHNIPHSNTENKLPKNISICQENTSPVLSQVPQPPPRIKRGQSLQKTTATNNSAPHSSISTPKIMGESTSHCRCAQSAPPNTQIEKINSYKNFPSGPLTDVTAEPILRKSFHDSGLHSTKSFYRPMSENMDPSLSTTWRCPTQFSYDTSGRNMTSSDTDSIFFDNLSSPSLSSTSMSSKECSHKKFRSSLGQGSPYVLLPPKMNQFSPTSTSHHLREKPSPKVANSMDSEVRKTRERSWKDRIDKKPDNLSVTSPGYCSMCSSSIPTPNNFSSDVDSEGTDSSKSFPSHSEISSNPFSNSSVLYRRGIRNKSSHVNRHSLSTVKEYSVSMKEFTEHIGSTDATPNSRRPLPIASRRPQSFTALDKYSQQRRPPQVPPRSQTRNRRKSTDILNKTPLSHFLKEEIKTAQHNFV